MVVCCHWLTLVTRPYPVSYVWQHLCCWSVIWDTDVSFLPSQLITLMRWECSRDSMSSHSYYKPTPTVNHDKAHLNLINGIFTVAGTKFKNFCDNSGGAFCDAKMLILPINDVLYYLFVILHPLYVHIHVTFWLALRSWRFGKVQSFFFQCWYSI